MIDARRSKQNWTVVMMNERKAIVWQVPFRGVTFDVTETGSFYRGEASHDVAAAFGRWLVRHWNGDGSGLDAYVVANN